MEKRLTFLPAAMACAAARATPPTAAPCPSELFLPPCIGDHSPSGFDSYPKAFLLSTSQSPSPSCALAMHVCSEGSPFLPPVTVSLSTAACVVL